ncbi:MAG: S1 RNA-binding domain-containing protein, partial [Lachnospiraceae bacterium]
CTGHFGLSAKYYCHFTSPIRRYPDLQIHRIIKENLHGGMSERRIEHYNRILPEVAKNSSLMERRADDAERETDKLKKVEYMSSRIGNVYDGVISGVTAYGFYVELPNTVEGMVHINTLDDDYYIFDEAHYELYGEVSHNTYKLGQQITIEVTGTDKLMKTIDFEVVRKD